MSVRSPDAKRLAGALVLALLSLAPSAAAQALNPGGGLPDDTPDPMQEPPAAIPDLAVYALGTVPNEPDSEHVFRVCAEIQNYGSAQPGPFNAAITLDGEEVASKRWTEFPRNGDTLCGDTRADAGRHSLEAHVDYDHEVVEQSEQNNRRAITITVTEPPLPDMTPTLQVTPDPPRRGGTITFAARVRNIGQTETGNFTVNFTYDGKFIARRSIPSLSPGHSYPVAAVLDGDRLREGDHVVRVVVDPNNRTRELNKENNVAEVSFNLPRIPKADLLVGDVSLQDAVREGQPLNVTINFRNQGDKPTPAFVARVMLDNRTTLGVPRFAQGLAANSEANTTIQWIARAPGNHSIRVVVDDEKVVTEEFETNNEEVVRFAVLPRDDVPTKPDLVVDRVLHVPEPPLAGAPVNFTAVVRNAGVVDSGRFDVAFRVDGVLVASHRAIGIPPGASVASTATWTGAAGEHVVTVTLDPANAIREANETNNEKNATFRVAAPAPPRPPARNDTAPTRPTTPTAPTTPPVARDNSTGATGNPDMRVKEVAALQNFRNRTTSKLEPRLAVTIRNDGAAVETRPFTAYFYLDDELVGEKRVTAAIRPEGRVVLTLPFEPAPGSHVVRVVALYDGETAAQVPATRVGEAKFSVADDTKTFVPAPALAGVVAAAAVAALATRRARAGPSRRR